MDFLAEFFGGRFSVAFTVLTAENTHRKFGWKNPVENFGENIPFFGAFFGTFFGAFFGEQLFASKSEKFVQNPFCKRDPLREYPRFCRCQNYHSAEMRCESFIFCRLITNQEKGVFRRGFLQECAVLLAVAL